MSAHYDATTQLQCNMQVVALVATQLLEFWLVWPGCGGCLLHLSFVMSGTLNRVQWITMLRTAGHRVGRELACRYYVRNRPFEGNCSLP